MNNDLKSVIESGMSYDDLMEEVRSRGLDEVEIIEPTKEELRKIICQALDINEMYDDEEICDMLKEIWNISKYKNGMK